MERDSYTSADLGKRVEQIIEGAERAAIEILRDAQERAQRLDEDREARTQAIQGELYELGHVAADLASQVEALRGQIEVVQRELGTGDVQPSSSTRRGPQEAARQAEPDPILVPEVPEVPESQPDSRPAAHDPVAELSPERLVAMQMAAARCSREEVEEHLRRRYGVADPAPILDELYGRQAV